jgi:addiction module HigA family antidote
MIPKNRISTHPGEILLKEFLEPMNLSQKSFSEQIHVSFQRINELVNGKRGITPESSKLLSKSLNTSPEFWMNLQSCYDLSKINREVLLKDIKKIRDLQTISY